MARRFTKVSEQEIKTAFFYPSDLVNTNTKLSPSGSVKTGGYTPRRFASRYISTTIHLPFGGQLYIIMGIVLYGMELGLISLCGCIVSEAPGSQFLSNPLQG